MKLLQGWYIYLARGIFAIVLGILLVTDKAQWNTLQYMGMFWLSIGLTSIAWARPPDRAPPQRPEQRTCRPCRTRTETHRWAKVSNP